ncbi:hypothetical protein Ga0061065_104130 [Marinomonas fungiae]|uniref:Uncharacterized protein n=1 Tax=Marinomonas fungiae TaxID=1137284 RepID=A0A0K6IKR9_9GAMM|nr:hypothetical protein Ga0061065_104130 [Marinomonas fungiae]
MHNTKSSISVIKELFTRLLVSSFFIFLLITTITLIRGIASDIRHPLSSDDWLWVIYFLIFWNGVPAFIASVISGLTRLTDFKSYMICVFIQMLAFYIYMYKAANIEGNELASSPFILLIYMAIPLALIYYPVFFFKKSWIYKFLKQVLKQ